MRCQQELFCADGIQPRAEPRVSGYFGDILSLATRRHSRAGLPGGSAFFSAPWRAGGGEAKYGGGRGR